MLETKDGCGKHAFLSKLFCFTVPNLFVEELYTVFQKVSGYQKTSCLRREYQDILSIIGSHSTIKFPKRILQCCKKLLMTQIFRDKRRREGVSRFSLENVFAHSAGKYCREPFLFQKVSGIVECYG